MSLIITLLAINDEMRPCPEAFCSATALFGGFALPAPLHDDFQRKTDPPT